MVAPRRSSRILISANSLLEKSTVCCVLDAQADRSLRSGSEDGSSGLLSCETLLFAARSSKTATPASLNMVLDIFHLSAHVVGRSLLIEITTRLIPCWMIAAAHCEQGGSGVTHSV